MSAKVGMLVIWLLAAGSSAGAATPGEWHPGELVLQDGTELSGEINFNWVAQVVQYRQGSRIKAYSAYQVQNFTFYDRGQSALRKFAAVTCSGKYGLRRPRILEQVTMGVLPVYRDLRPSAGLPRVSRVSDFTSDEEFNKDLDNFNYLVVNGEDLIPMDKFYRQVWPRIENKLSEEKEYAALIRTDTSTIRGQLRVIRIYNALTDKRVEATPQETSAPASGL